MQNLTTASEKLLAEECPNQKSKDKPIKGRHSCNHNQSPHKKNKIRTSHRVRMIIAVHSQSPMIEAAPSPHSTRWSINSQSITLSQEAYIAVSLTSSGEGALSPDG